MIVNFPLAVDEARAIVPVDVPGIPNTGADVYDGAPVVVAFLPNTVPPAAFARAAVNVPVVVTADDGVEDNTVPSPVNVTEVTVPTPAGRSAVTRDRNVGVAAPPLVGPAHIRFAVSVASVTANVPEEVTGDPATLKIAGMVSPTDVTAPVAVDAIVNVFPAGVIVIFDPAARVTAPANPFNDVTPDAAPANISMRTKLYATIGSTPISVNPKFGVWGLLLWT